MKNIINTIMITLTIISCKAQSPVINITDYQNRVLDITGAYIKDIDNQLNIYEGTYVYTNGNTSLKIVLQKKTMSYDGKQYEDLIIGEYQYIKDGLEIINTLPRLNQMYSNQSFHSISGNRVLTGNQMGCSECSPTEKRLITGIVEKETDNWGQLSIRTTTENGQPAIKVHLYWHYRTKRPNTPDLPRASFPGGNFIMIKQQ